METGELKIKNGMSIDQMPRVLPQLTDAESLPALFDIERRE